MKAAGRMVLTWCTLLLAAGLGAPSLRAQTKDPLRSWDPTATVAGVPGGGPLVSFAGRLLRLGGEGCIFAPDLTATAPLRALRSDDGFAGFAQSPTALVAVFTRQLPPPGLTGPIFYRTTVFRSTDGVRWAETFSSTQHNATFRQIVFTGEKFVLSRSTGQLESSDGTTWTAASGTGPTATAVRFRTAWYAGAQQSPDGVTWTTWATPPPIAPFNLVASATVLLAWNGSGETATSTDGTTWTTGATLLAPQLRSIRAAGDAFYADLGGQSYAVSTDGSGWQRTDFTKPPFASGLVAHGATIVGLDADSRPWRREGATWIPLLAPALPPGTALAHAAADGVALQTTLQVTDWQLWLSVNGGAFTQIVGAPAARIRGLARAPGGVWLAAFENGALWRSDDGQAWAATAASPLPEEPLAIAHARGRFAVLGKTSVFTSTNGQSWQQTPASFDGLCASRGQFYAFRHDSDTSLTPSVFRSDDAFSWIACTLPAPGGTWIHPSFTRALHRLSLAEIDGRVVLASGYTVWGDSARTMTAIYRSADGANWEYATALTGDTPSLAAAGSRFVLATPFLHVSSDGATWTRLPGLSRSSLVADDDRVHADGLSVARRILPRPGLAGLSTRGFVGTGPQAMIAGFVITGDRPRQVLLRGCGPTIATYGVSGTLADPEITLVRMAGPGAGVVATNNDWSTAPNAAEIAAAAQRLGEFPYPVGSKDAALVLTLEPGIYTLEVRGHDGGTGVALAEVYDAEASPTDTSERRIVALSTRLQVKSADAVAIAGLIVQGTRSKQMLLRGLGPELARFGVPGVLTQPRLALYRVQNGVEQLVHTAAAWADETNAPDLAIAFDECGVSALPVGSLDSAMLVELQPGAYTIHLASSDGTEGTGLIEAYEVR